MVELDRTNQYDRVKPFSGILKRIVDTSAYASYLELNKVKDLDSEKRIRAELKKRGYTLKANFLFKAPKTISKTERIRELVRAIIHTKTI